ncbi:frataxin [Nematocida homosporus]|uniref:frataxin n=1 Tax=Nematocida homosporus TaxID=1912981 RepID=UPI00221E68D9|nr:frataxin [Nematocida homosporus]KAI5184565.1 frataxin [Nematocida homosporus]
MVLLESTYNSISTSLLDRAFDLMESLGGDVQKSSGVVTAVFPLLGTYVLSRQPPKREIWLSSPVSGPHHFRGHPSDAPISWLNRSGDALFSFLSNELTSSLASHGLSTRNDNLTNEMANNNRVSKVKKESVGLE